MLAYENEAARIIYGIIDIGFERGFRHELGSREMDYLAKEIDKIVTLVLKAQKEFDSKTSK